MTLSFESVVRSPQWLPKIPNSCPPSWYTSNKYINAKLSVYIFQGQTRSYMTSRLSLFSKYLVRKPQCHPSAPICMILGMELYVRSMTFFSLTLSLAKAMRCPPMKCCHEICSFIYNNSFFLSGYINSIQAWLHPRFCEIFLLCVSYLSQLSFQSCLLT